MKTTNRETLKLTVNILIRKFCEDKAAKNFSMSKQEAEDYGACEETSLREEDKDNLNFSGLLTLKSVTPTLTLAF
ncbi:hypothetical protein [Parasutterella sp.]|uniref:hypothetical protein n=1 Tax=Parasutterella sp. TaxID=2049037 RepID=UPI003AB4F450